MVLLLRTWTNRTCCVFGLGILLLSSGTILTFSKSWIMDIMRSLLVLKPNSMIEEYWQKPPTETFTDVYLFNWTNPEDIRNRSIKPKFEQIGPYRFIQNIEKVNIVWNDNNTITYNQVRYWHFDEKTSVRNLSDKIVSVNILTLILAHKVRYWNYLSKFPISTMMNVACPDVHVIRTAKKLLYDGHHDFGTEVAKTFQFIMPELPHLDHHGLLSFMNASPPFEGVFNMENGINKNYEVRNWNFFSKTPYFEGDCANVRGSAGEIHSTKLSRDHITIFYGHVCRTVVLEYEKDVIVDGILGYKFSAGSKIFDNGTLVPENKCYCTGDCIPSGILNISECRYGLPAFISLPNFYLADPTYLHAIEGLHPDERKHETYIVVEPITGVTLEAVLRGQINALLHSIEDIKPYENVPEIVFPLMWLDTKVTIPEQLLPMLKMVLYTPFVCNIISYTLMVLGMCLIITAIACGWRNRKLRLELQSSPLKPEEVPLKR